MNNTECPIILLEKMRNKVIAEPWVNEEAKKHFVSGIKISIDKLKHHGFTKEQAVIFKPRLNPDQLSFL